MRLIATILLEKNYVVQTYGYKVKKVIGDPKITIRHLDLWEVDEIIILQIDQDFNYLMNNLKQIVEVCSTPLTVGGGIENLNQALELIKNGADRICIQRPFFNNLNLVFDISNNLGGQALTIKIDFDNLNKKFKLNNYDFLFFKNYFESCKLDLIRNGVFEFFFNDINADGIINYPCFDLVDYLELKEFSIIFGGGLKPNYVNDIWKKYSHLFEDLSLSFSNYFYQKELPNIEVIRYLKKIPNLKIRDLVK